MEGPTSKTHTAYDHHQLLKLPEQIESMAAFDDKLLVGTKLGYLLFYSVDRRYREAQYDVQLIRYNKGVSKKPIQQLATLPEQDIFLKLSDNLVAVHNLSDTSFPVLKTIGRTKGATAFAVHVQKHVSLTGNMTSMVRLCVVVKRKLQFYYLKNGECLELRSDISLRDVPKTISWVQDSICIGFKGSYAIVTDLVSPNGKLIELFPTGKQTEPVIAAVTSEQNVSDNWFLLGKDTLSVFVNPDGTPTTCSSVKWTDLPLAIVHDEPYLIGVLPNYVEVKTNTDSAPELTTLPLKDVRTIAVSKSGLIYAASTEAIWILSAVPTHSQIPKLLTDKNFELALRLANIGESSPEEKQSEVHRIRTQYAFELFNNKNYQKSMDEFFKLGTDPYSVIKLFPELVSRDDDSPSRETSDQDIENGYLALIKYLTDVRAARKADSTRGHTQLMQIIDTTLLKCYLRTNDAFVSPILRKNYCNLEETERMLKKYQKYRELILLYQTKGLHEKALELLKKLSDVDDSPLRGVDQTILYLQALGQEHIELILRFSEWVLESHPEEGLKIFTEEMPEVESLPRPKILDFLLRTDNHNLIIPYLEHVIHAWKDTSSILHNALAHQYRKQILTLGLETPQAKSLKTKLYEFLETSNYYQPSAVLSNLPTDCMFEERALICGRNGEHEIALGIYLLVLSDYRKALEFCDKTYKERKEGHQRVYIQMLRLLLHPPDSLPGIKVPLSHPADAPKPLATALDLLEGYPDRIPVLDALQLIPDDVSLQQLRSFLIAGVQETAKKRRDSQLLRGLLKAQKLQLRKQKMDLESKKIEITELMVCNVCKKKFVSQSAFVRYPNGDVVHYSCQDKVK